MDKWMDGWMIDNSFIEIAFKQLEAELNKIYKNI
jgi:hypothetical protein